MLKTKQKWESGQQLVEKILRRKGELEREREERGAAEEQESVSIETAQAATTEEPRPGHGERGRTAEAADP